MLMDHLGVSADRIQTAEDGSTLSLGDLTLESSPRPGSTAGDHEHVRPGAGLLLSCDFFGATSPKPILSSTTTS